jgi:hypothetical protein
MRRFLLMLVVMTTAPSCLYPVYHRDPERRSPSELSSNSPAVPEAPRDDHGADCAECRKMQPSAGGNLSPISTTRSPIVVGP